MWEHLDEDFYYTHSARNVHEVINSLENSEIPYNLLKLTEETTIKEEVQLKDGKESTTEDGTRESERDVADDFLVDILWDAKQTSDLIKSISKAFEKLSK